MTERTTATTECLESQTAKKTHNSHVSVIQSHDATEQLTT